MPKPTDTHFFSSAALQQIIDDIEENLLTELTPDLIASHFFVSVSTLSALFKTACGMTIMEYVRNRRLTLAAEELSASHIPILELSAKYGYETPEAFTKAFSRFAGFPPSFVRRGFPVSRIFLPLQVSVTVHGGWSRAKLTKSDAAGQETRLLLGYNASIRKEKEGAQMEPQKTNYQIHTDRMQFQKVWQILLSLSADLLRNRIPFKVDGKTMIFAHGLEFLPDKICLTFLPKDMETVRDYFHYEGEINRPEKGFWFLDTRYGEMKIRCMFYGCCSGADTEEFLYRNTDPVQIDHLLIRVQSLTFYYENAEKDSPYYQMVADRLNRHENYRRQNKKAWEYSAYDFWLDHGGLPSDMAKRILENPVGMLKKYAGYFDGFTGVRIANICGSCGKKAISLAVLGAAVTVFDFSEENQRYALEVAAAAHVDIRYEVCDVLEINMETYGNYFDVVFMEGGILHYFHNIDEFMQIMYTLLKPGGKMICSDFHPFTKTADILHLEQPPAMSYFSTDVFEGEMAHARFYEEPLRAQIPKCLYRKYTLSEIINATIRSGFTLQKFDEHPAWTNERLPGEFTLIAIKQQAPV